MTRATSLYLANAAVLLCHQVDAAYWHEWELFGLPGGPQLFVALNVPIAWLVLRGAVALAASEGSAARFVWLLAGCGFLAVGLHGYFLLGGDASFTAPVSLALLGATLVLSVAQCVLASRR